MVAAERRGPKPKLPVTKRSTYRMGFLMVLFDLPVVEDRERRAASRFRKDLLDLGFQMMQESVYVRHAVSLEKLESQRAKVRAIMPDRGLVTCLFLTDRQWLLAENMIGVPAKRAKKAGDPGEGQLLFW